jgi:hypothetical protein
VFLTPTKRQQAATQKQTADALIMNKVEPAAITPLQLKDESNMQVDSRNRQITPLL